MGHNTGNELPSNDILDFEDNTENLDRLMNVEEDFWEDRFGNKRPTIDYALRMAGFTPAGFDFTTGGVLQPGDRNKCVFNQVDQTWYSYAGDLPYNVIPNTDPTKSPNWVLTDYLKSFKSSLLGPTGPELVGVKTIENNLAELLTADDLAISYGAVTKSVKNRLAKRGCKVVLVGDSLSSFFNIDTVNISSIFESYLRRKIMEINNTAIFYNRAIGGQRYYDLGKDTPVFNALNPGYPWYSDITKRWYDYINALNPDVIFVAFGMNDGPGWDGGNFQQANFNKMVNELRSIGSFPEIVFCTNILPSTIHETTKAFDQQNGRDAMAGWTRSYALKYGYSFIDINRRFKCLRDGVDPCFSSYSRKTIVKEVDLPYVHNEMSEMYSGRVTVMDPAVLSAGIQFQLSPYLNNILGLSYNEAASSWMIVIYTASAGTVGIAQKVIAKGPAPISGTEIYFTTNDSVVTITIGMNTDPIFSDKIVKFGGKFFPKISGNGRIKLDLIGGKLLPVKAELSDYDIYNTDGDGGNGINHPTAHASSRIYSRTLDGWFGLSPLEDKVSSINIDFIENIYTVSNKYSPECNQIGQASKALTFINGGLVFNKTVDGSINGAIFGSTNRAHIISDLFNKSVGPFSSMAVEVEFIAPPARGYLLTTGENTTSDRIVLQVSDKLTPRGTMAVAPAGACDLVGSDSFPYVPGMRHIVKFEIDASKSTGMLYSNDNEARVNSDNNNITSIPASVISKIKFGYISPTTFGGDVVISKVRIDFKV